eukprot:TRINITY_DN1721_c0_g1_i1.p1 TRINITY_DN1721_c0_g1~~TRINITY_DN1721_c0_g1_i1.p1  ORF type:complete len:416 (-),score=130.17 TRINITY_DN1721_c0_g1_i1:91-1245(-)
MKLISALKKKDSKDTKESKTENERKGSAGTPVPAGQGDEEEMIFGHDNKKVTADDFELVAVIGRGSFGKVMQVKKKDDGKFFAMKVLRKDTVIARKQVEHTKAEKAILQKISHPFIISLRYSFQTKEKLYMILDFVNGGEIFTHLKKEGRFSEERVRFYAAELSLALGYLHSHNVAYRDLKPENVLLDSEGHIRITDFGLSKEVEKTIGTTTFCGTPEYLAPEVLKGEPHGVAVDWWSLGIMLFEMMASLPPFFSPNTNVMYQKILTAKIEFPAHFSADACSFISALLQRDAQARLGGGDDDVEAVKAHPWFKGFNWSKLERREVTPPFVPQVNDITDLKQIDVGFTSEKAVDSLVENDLTEQLNGEGDTFQGFTYVGDNGLAE